MTKLFLTNRALDDLQEIYDYSCREFNKSIAEKYIKSIEDAFSLLKENKGLLKRSKKISSRFVVYPVRKHILICEVRESTIYIITVKHTSMNLLERLKELEPHLDEEVKILQRRIKF